MCRTRGVRRPLAAAIMLLSVYVQRRTATICHPAYLRHRRHVSWLTWRTIDGRRGPHLHEGAAYARRDIVSARERRESVEEGRCRQQSKVRRSVPITTAHSNACC